MKNKSVYAISLSLFMLMNLISCKKDAINIGKGKEKHYSQINASHIFDYEMSNAIELTLYPHGEANLIPGGDVGYKSKYKIKGKQITVEIMPPNQLTMHFTIISEKELRGTRGQILKLTE